MIFHEFIAFGRFYRNNIFLAIVFVSTFASPHLSAQDTSFVPNWVKDAIVYQIFPERFANGDSTNDPPDVQPWNGEPTFRNYFGGDIQGIIDHLDYVQSLGANTIYLTPIFESPTNHKYQTTDYYTIDPHFGTEKLFQRLVDACHARHLRIILDAVFNHTGRDFFAFKDILKNQERSKYIHWYTIHSFPVSNSDPPNYEAFWGESSLPKLNTDNPEVRKYLFDVTAYWTSKGIDGWRLDVADGPSHDFWIQWRKVVKKINPNIYISGEIWDDASAWLHGDQFDGVMNYRFRGACVGFFALDNRNAKQFDSILEDVDRHCPPDVSYGLMNLIGSHDTERFLTLCDGDVDKLKLAVLFQMTYLGIPTIYYGDEIGMTGGRDPGCRHTMMWDTTKWNSNLRAWYREMITMRNTYGVFRRGTVRTIIADSTKNLYVFTRRDSASQAVVIINNSTNHQTITTGNILPSGNNWFDFIHEKNLPQNGMIDLAPRSGTVLISSKGK